MTDTTQALRDAENAIRDIIGYALRNAIGESWEDNCGVSAERLSKWKERKKYEILRQSSGIIEERLIYYADFYDLKVIIRKQWEVFKPIFIDLQKVEFYLNELERYRDPDAHRRELLPHQKALIVGISGELRNMIVRYRSKKENAEDYFPRIESARDSLGSIWVPKTTRSDLDTINTGMTLRVGDAIQYVVTASDPEGGELEYGIGVYRDSTISWQTKNQIELLIRNEHVGLNIIVILYIRSNREHHAYRFWDDMVAFIYRVLPNK